MNLTPHTLTVDGKPLNGPGLRHIQQLLATDGFVYLDGLPEGTDYLSLLSALGNPLAQYNGALIRDIKPDPAISNDVVSAQNTAELTPHTEMYELPEVPPRYVALWAVHPADSGGGETTLADAYQLLTQFSREEIDQLHRVSYTWRSRPTLAGEGIELGCLQPVLTDTKLGTIVRFSSLDVSQTDDLITRYITVGRDFFAEQHVTVRIDRNALLIWDNWRMLHARNAFTDRRRHLRRILLAA